MSLWIFSNYLLSSLYVTEEAEHCPDMKIVSVVGARPNFMKIAPVSEELRANNISHVLIHTGQHYDYTMSKLFFEDLALPKPDIDLGIGSGTHAKQTGDIMMGLEPVLRRENPSLVLVVGDVNSTMAAAITAAKLGIPVAHVEAGLRSFDRTMPEEINRIVTDSIANYHFTTEESANENLRREGFSESIFFVGNTMIDTLLKHVDRAEQSTILQRFGMNGNEYGVVTVHRPSNVDRKENIQTILDALNVIARDLPLIFPMHPRTRERIRDFSLNHLVNDLPFRKEGKGGVEKGVFVIEPLGYLDFLKLMKDAKIVFTDSGGIQEETTVLGIPCITLRENTERPVTVTTGTNVIVGANKEKIVGEARKRLNSHSASFSIPPLWDGQAAMRIVEIITRFIR
jgi:UDP-N-acetylglucosamine 2-epimerase (non-hydrolysing)